MATHNFPVPRFEVCEARGCPALRYPGKRFCYHHWMQRLNWGCILLLFALCGFAWVLRVVWGVS